MSSEIMETSKAILLELAEAGSGQICRLPVTQDLYPEESLKATVEAFANYCEIVMEQGSESQAATLSIRVRDEHRREGRQVIGSLLSFLLDHAFQCRFRSEAGR